MSKKNDHLAIFFGVLGGILGIIPVVDSWLLDHKILNFFVPYLFPYILLLMLGGVAAFFLVWDFSCILETRNFLDRCLETKGAVTSLSWHYHKVKSDGSILTPHEHYMGPTRQEKVAHPVVQFVDERSGRAFTVRGLVGSKPPSYHVGDEVRVLYDPENPSNARIKSFWQIWGIVVLLTFLSGIPLAFICLIALF